VTESFPSPAAQRKAENEIAAFRQCQELSRSFVAVNEQIWQARPVEETLTPQEKTAEAIQQEVAQEVNRVLQVVFNGWHKTGRIELEAIDLLVRDSMHRADAATVQRLRSAPVSHDRKVPCACGQETHYHESRRKQLLTMLGPVVFDRAYYLCAGCHQGQSPRDRELDVVGTECSPGVRRIMAVVGSESSFHGGREQLLLLAGFEVTTKAVERHAEAIGADIVRRE
jgi:hypothetical protein